MSSSSALCSPSALPIAQHLAVAVVHKAADKAERFFLAAPTHFDCRHEHRILGDDCVLLLLAGYRFFVVSAARAFEVFEKRFGKQLFKLGAERAVQHYVADFRRGRGGDGSYFVVVILLAYIKLVLGVQRVTRVRERGERVVLLLFGEVLAIRRFHRFCARGVSRRTLELLCCGFQILDFIPFVRQVFAFYDFTHFNCAPFVFFASIVAPFDRLCHSFERISRGLSKIYSLFAAPKAKETPSRNGNGAF